MFETIENKEITIIDLPVQLCGSILANFHESFGEGHTLNIYYKVRFKVFELLLDSNQFQILFLKYFKSDCI